MSSSSPPGAPRRRPRLLARPQLPPGPAQALKTLLYELYLKADAPTLDEIRAMVLEDAHEDLPGSPSRDTISRCISKPGVPKSADDVATVAMVLAYSDCSRRAPIC